MFEKVFFVLAPNFHGATILSKILNAHPEIVSLGDTYPSNRFDQVCGCGAKVSACPFWKKIKVATNASTWHNHPHILPNYPQILNDYTDKFLYNIFNTNSIASLVQVLNENRVLGFKRSYELFLQEVFNWHSDSAGPRLFIDGVKSISRIKALIAAGFEVSGVIHLYRSPGNYIKSYMKQRNHKGILTFITRSLIWRAYHLQAKKLHQDVPYFPLTYEMLGSNTDIILEKLFDFLEVEKMTIDQLQMNFDQTWHFMGNASLFQFDGRFYVSRYEFSLIESSLIRLLAGVYNEQCAE